MKNLKKVERHRVPWKIIRKCLITLKRQALEFCRETGLHGYRYIGEAHRSMVERIAWTIMVIASLCIAIMLMNISFNYYFQHPILSVIESTHQGIWNYPFPAVTVCDLNRVSLKLTRKFVEKLKIPPTMSKELLVQEMSLLNELLYPARQEANIRINFSRLQSIFDTNNLSIPTAINSVTRSCQSLLESCKWKAQERNCSSIFRTSYSRDGICCSFNHITHDKLLKKPKVKSERMASCGHQSGLIILLNFDPEDYHASIVGSIGFKVMLHDPYDYPGYDAPGKLIGVNKYSFITVQPQETYSTESVKRLPFTTRPCIFNDEGDMIKENKTERNLIFARYSFVNCMVECRATVIKRKCGCIPYYYPQNGTRICNLRDIECLEKFKFWFDTSWPGTDMSPKTSSLLEVNIDDRPCNCKPDCNFYRYFLENSLGNLDKQVYYNGLTYTKHSSKGTAWKNQSILHVFFDDLVSIRYRRDVHYSWRHLFATFGGLLGLFAGFSLVSVFELFYFLIIRVIINAWPKKKDKRSMNTVKIRM